ncbi:MAG TPA: universal stress protein [Pyrinomonadaceae bacterium]|nr:universal stress protein [Pyrinomonadaceae bacterium]
MRIERILCPTDLTPDSTTALRYAAALAKAYDAQLIQIYCENSAAGSQNALDVKPAELLEADLREYANSSEAQALGWKSIVVACDDPGDCITREAARQRADLIIMRSRRRPHRAALLGSVAESVSRTAPCPVLVMHSDERDLLTEGEQSIGLKRLLVAYDFSDHAELALKLGLSIAQEYQAELHLVHVLPPFTLDEPEISWYPLGKEGVYHKAARRLQKVVPDEVHLWCNIKTVICEGQPYREIIHYAQRNEIDLVCLGAQGAGFGLMTLFGSNVDRVLRQAPCPVLVARPLRHIRKSANEFTEAEVIGKSEMALPVATAFRHS